VLCESGNGFAHGKRGEKWIYTEKAEDDGVVVVVKD
jgi:uncharacterized membrane protein YgcG